VRGGLRVFSNTKVRETVQWLASSYAEGEKKKRASGDKSENKKKVET